MTYMTTPSNKNPTPGVMKFTILVTPPPHTHSPAHHYSMCLIYTQESKRRFKIDQFYIVYPQNYPPLGQSVMKFTIYCLFNLNMIHIKFS